MKPKKIDCHDDMGLLPIDVIDSQVVGEVSVFACHWVDQDRDVDNVFILVFDGRQWMLGDKSVDVETEA